MYLRFKVLAGAATGVSTSTGTVFVMLSTGFSFFCIQEGGASTSFSLTQGGLKLSRRGPLSLLTLPIGMVIWGRKLWWNYVKGSRDVIVLCLFVCFSYFVLLFCEKYSEIFIWLRCQNLEYCRYFFCV